MTQNKTPEELNNVLSKWEQRMEAIADEIKSCDSSLKAIHILQREMRKDSIVFALWVKENYFAVDDDCWTEYGSRQEYTTEELYEFHKN